MYSFILGNIQGKGFQTIEIDGKVGSILYFIFDKETDGARGFVEGLLWGGSKPTKEHPEEIITNGNTMIIICYPYICFTHFKG